MHSIARDDRVATTGSLLVGSRQGDKPVVAEDRSIRFLLVLVAVAVATLWLLPLSSSLWLDELDTYFTAKDGVSTAIARNAYVHPQCSQLYDAMIALWLRAFGSTEALLRLPSVLAMAVAAVLVFRLGSMLFDRETGALGTLVFVTTHDVLFAAGDARSYACATAASVAATVALVHLLAPRSLAAVRESGDGRQASKSIAVTAAIYAVLAALTVYLHQVFALLLVAHAAVIVVVLLRGDTRVRLPTFIATGLATMLLLGAEAPNLLATFVGRELIVHSPAPSPLFLINLWASPLFVIAVVPVAFALYANGRRGSVMLPEAPGFAWLLLLACATLPPLLLFLVSRLTPTHVFLPRYYLSCQPALAIVLGAVLRGFEPRSARMVAAVSVAAIAIAMYARPYHTDEEWREMIAAVGAAIDEETVVAMDAGFIEGADANWLATPRNDDRYAFLLAPLSYYPLHGRIHLLPYRLDARTRPYFESELLPLLGQRDRFVVISRGRAPRWWSLWLDGRYGTMGYEARPLHDSALLGAVAYERRRDAIQPPPSSPTTNGTTK